MIIDKVNDILNSCSSSTTLLELCSYIKKNIHRIPNLNIDDISNESLAKLCGISTVYFRKLFYKIYKVAPIKYLKKVRLDKAKELLIGDFTSVSDVATLVGFSSVYTFSKTFKKEIGVAPTEYAKTAELS